MSALLIIKANIGSYDHWRTAYDKGLTFRRENGVTRDEVYCSPDSTLLVLVLHYFDTVDAANSFVSNPEFTEVMRSSGVIGSPHMVIAETV